MSIIVPILVLGFLIFIHELGHFLVAKLCNVGVIEFAIGFGPKIFSRRIGETRYSLRLLPLGGFVRMIGDDPYSLTDEGASEIKSGGKSAEDILVGTSPQDDIPPELLKAHDRWLINKRLPQKAAIVLAGPIFNLIFAYFAAVIAINSWGISPVSEDAIVGEVAPGFPAEKAGLKAGDHVLTVDGDRIKAWEDLDAKIRASKVDQILVFEVERKEGSGVASRLQFSVKPTREVSELTAIEENPESRPMIGIIRGMSDERYFVPFTASLTLAAARVYDISQLTLRMLGRLVTGVISTKHIGGPITIVHEISKSAGRGLEDVVATAALLSISLFIFNLLPIPVLDGGHLLFFLIEGIKGTRVSLRVYSIATQMGLVIILGLTLFAVSNDLRRLFW
jgi:regulator of sigma E protease